MRDERKDSFEIFEEKGDGVPYSQLPERKHESFRQLLISVFYMLQCLEYPDVKSIVRFKALAKCRGVIKDMAEDLGEEQSNLSHWLLALEKTFERNKRRLQGKKKKPKKKGKHE